jgi:hypothetical protein
MRCRQNAMRCRCGEGCHAGHVRVSLNQSRDGGPSGSPRILLARNSMHSSTLRSGLGSVLSASTVGVIPPCPEK